jgi:pimeloyl-ACP methyl ester carboxylesterase
VSRLVPALVVLTGVAFATTAPAPLTASHPCPHANGFTCSTLTVPLDHSGRRGGSLKLQVAVADDVDAPRGVLLVIAGGPGQPGVPYVAPITAILGPIARQYRVVMYDQRGTGAGALRCPALQAAVGGSDLYPPPTAAVRACARAIGTTRSFYGTDDVVADMEALRQALGVDAWTLDGVSYGTFVGERYAIAYPQRVKRLVLDSVVPHNAGYELVPLELHAMRRVLQAACGSGCLDDLAAVVKRLGDGPELLAAVTRMSVDPTFRKPMNLADILRRARGGDAGPLNHLLRTIRGWESARAEDLSQGLHASALCTDWRFPWGDSGAPVAGRNAKLARVGSALRASDLWPFDRATATGIGYEQECLPWPSSPPTPPAARLLPLVSTLLLSGDRDLSTPLEWARREAVVAPRGHLVVIHGAGHSIQNPAMSDTARHALVAFLTG